MKNSRNSVASVWIRVVLLVPAMFAPIASAKTPDGVRIEALTRLKGKLNESEGVFKVTFRVPTSGDSGGRMSRAGLTAWAAFTAPAITPW